ncbi:uncharacterized protein LOC128875802 [Hylaeus volcanicus]|uniref:uncharacterized protein LOC128875802 n=1 Tax=Hylaeus volcanicus TaxID=313075 RepID=UPI0023B78AAF|nr:uncharacterized protein LOC128875802 [Hylaeus volcanicus]
MQNSVSNMSDMNSNEEWSSFCSSCKSVLHSICSIGDLSVLDELIDENNVKTWIEKYQNIIETSDATNKKNEKREINKINNDQSDFHINKKVKCIEPLNKTDKYQFDRSKILSREIINIDSMKIAYDQNIEQEEIYEISNTKVLPHNAKEDTESVNDSFFASNFVSSIESQSTAQNILHHHRNILDIAQSILSLSNYIDDMGKMILQGIRSKQTVQKYQNYVNNDLSDGNQAVKTLKSQDLPIYGYNSLCINKK